MHQSQTMVRAGVTQSRTHDHLFDPVYTVSNQTVHIQEHQRSQMSNVERVPEWNNMFSEVRTHPRHNYRMKPPKVPMPAFPPRAKAAGQVQQSTLVGKERYKYFKRPVVPFLQGVPADILLAPAKEGQQDPMEQPTTADLVESATRTVGVQTLYRESETQTDPYSANYVLTPGEAEPEVLSIAHLTYGHGLPASADEIQMIQRAREKREFEENLPPITDEASFEERKRLLEERELKEWAVREEEMRKEQEDRLNVLIETLKERERKNEELARVRVEAVRSEKMRDRDLALGGIHRERVKVHRMLGKTKKFGETEKKNQRRDVIGEHTSFGSAVYAPVAREGRLPVKNQVVDYGIPLISNFQGLAALEQTLPRDLAQMVVHKPEKIVPKAMATRKGQQIAADLEYVDKLLNAKKQGGTGKAQTLKNVYKKFEPVVRPPTPEVEAEDDSEEQAVLLLQRLVRGRAVQNAMYEGKQKALQLIKELRIDQEEAEAERKADASESLAYADEDPAQLAIDAVQGEIVAHALEFISQEIVRVKEEKKIGAMVRQANRVRRVREAEESGRRQAEDIFRVKREAKFKTVQDTHRESADRFLDKVFSAAAEQVAQKTARREVDVQANALGPIVDEFESQKADAAAIARELVTEFLLPEVDRQRIKKGEMVEERRFVYQAHKSVTEAIEQVKNKSYASE